MTDLSVDPREMRKRMLNYRFDQCGLDGTQYPSALPYRGAQILARRVMVLCEREGYSGEDAMTVLAYAALVQLEKHVNATLDELVTRPLGNYYPPG